MRACPTRLNSSYQMEFTSTGMGTTNTSIHQKSSHHTPASSTSSTLGQRMFIIQYITSQNRRYTMEIHKYKNIQCQIYMNPKHWVLGGFISPTSLPSVGFMYILALDVLVFVYLHCVSSILTCCVLINKHPLSLSTKDKFGFISM